MRKLMGLFESFDDAILDEDISADLTKVDIQEKRAGDRIIYTVYYDETYAGTMSVTRSGEDWLIVEGDIDPRFGDLGLDYLVMRKIESIAIEENRAVRRSNVSTD